MRLELNARGSWAVVGEFQPELEQVVRDAAARLNVALTPDPGAHASARPAPSWRITDGHDPDSNGRRVVAYLDPRKGFAWSDE
jgi:hypothetical protein